MISCLKPCFNFVSCWCSAVQYMRSIVTDKCVCLCVSTLSDRITPEPHVPSLTNFSACCLCPWLGPAPACWRKAASHRLSAARGTGVRSQRRRSVPYLWPPHVIGQAIYIFMLWFLLLMVALCNYIFALWFLSIYLSFFYSSLNLSGHRLDVYHTSTHGVALVQI